jgi:hypothetical protein
MNVKKRYRVHPFWNYALAIPAALTCVMALAAPASASGAASAVAPAVAAAPAVEVCGQGPAVARPTNMILTCADDGELAANLHWASWTAAKATATGKVTWRACSTLCADSRRRDSTSADYTLSDPVHVAGQGTLFTRLELHVTGRTPRGFLRNVAFDETPVTGATPAVSHKRGIRAAPSGTLGYAEIEGYWLYAGGPDGSSGGYTDAQIAAAITGAESSFLPGIIQPDVDYCGAGSDRAGWGLWQITCGNSVPQYGTDFQILDPWNNAEEAVYKCEQDVDAGDNCFDPWSTYTEGTYENFLQTTSPDMSISDPGEYVQVNSTPSGTPSAPAPDPGSTYGPPMPNGSVAGNLLANGSFENSGGGWDRIIPSGATTNITRYDNAADAHDGSWYLAFNTTGAGGSVYQDVPVSGAAGASYLASAWLSSQSGTATGRLCVWGLASPGTDNCQNYSVTAGTYRQVQVAYDLPASYSTLRFQVYPTPGGGTTDMDTASLLPNLLANGSFENSEGGWDRIIPSGATTNITRYDNAADAHDGSWYLAFNTTGAGGSIYQDVAVNASAGASYTATAWLTSQSGTATGRLCVWGLASPGTDTCESYSVAAGTWTPIQVVYDLPASYATLRFQVYPTPGGGTTDMDTASLVPSLLANGSFENSEGSWDRIIPSGATTNITRYDNAADAHDGSWYLAFNTTGAGGSIYQDVTVNGSAGDSYVATAWLTSQSGTATGRACIWGLASPGTDTCANYSVTAGTWTPVQIVYDLPASYGTVRFQVYPTVNGGTTDMDTTSLG